MTLAIIAIVLLVLILITLVFILNTLKKQPLSQQQKIEIPKIEIPKIELPKIELPKIEIPKIELPKIEVPMPKIEIPKIEIPKIELPKIEMPAAAGGGLDLAPVINELAKTLQETSALMRVNQAEFQSGLSAFHKAIDKLLNQIPSGDKELNAQKEFMQKFEEAMRASQEAATESMNENSLRLQEILAEVLNKEAK